MWCCCFSSIFSPGSWHPLCTKRNFWSSSIMHYVDTADADDFPNVSKHNKLNRHMNLPSFNIHGLRSSPVHAAGRVGRATKEDKNSLKPWKQNGKIAARKHVQWQQKDVAQILFLVVFLPASASLLNTYLQYLAPKIVYMYIVYYEKVYRLYLCVFVDARMKSQYLCGKRPIGSETLHTSIENSTFIRWKHKRWMKQ